MSTGPPTIPPKWTPEMSDFVREKFQYQEELATVKELFFAEFGEMMDKLLKNKLLEEKELDAWLLSLRPAGCS